MSLAHVADAFRIRAGALPDDVDLCAEIWVRAVEARDGTVDAEAMAERVRSAFGNPIVRFAVVDAPRHGFALVESGRADPREALLHFLAVHPGGVGSGVGRALLADAVEHAARAAFRSLTLEVRTTNVRAIEMYTRAGFVPFGGQIPHPLGGDPMQSYRLALAGPAPGS
ncbi:GNAT family N-acetyltransferase [Microterricola viridarii]|uniref:Acetyltransferase (GNAT) family protein n=1 Tax=Microterricola viridarii TaxID=412690 RepID=A0A1H1MQ09_9MICO|nr:GNAT family N-acetyltransferase [Microterricola viridarii]SDR88445.1 Acetyltransferase (GNAT) family protein [Microterricola viridarii]